MTTSCPKLSKFDSTPIVITDGDQFELNLSTFERAVGTDVDVSCYLSHTLIGANRLTCLSTGQWNNPVPLCSGRIIIQTKDDNASLSQEEYIVIGVASALGLIMTILFIGVLCFVATRLKDPKFGKGEQKPEIATIRGNDETVYNPISNHSIHDTNITEATTTVAWDHVMEYATSQDVSRSRSLPVRPECACNNYDTTAFSLHKWSNFPAIPRPDYDDSPGLTRNVNHGTYNGNKRYSEKGIGGYRPKMLADQNNQQTV